LSKLSIIVYFKERNSVIICPREFNSVGPYELSSVSGNNA